MASLFEESRAYAADLMAVTGRQAYFLEVPDAASAAELSVVSFEATERMGAPTEVRIQLTHPGKLAREDYLNRDATFLIDPALGTPRRFSGFIASLSTLKTTKDFTRYEVIVRSHFARLDAVITSQIYQHQTTPQIIEAVLRRHGLKGHQFAFRLRRAYPQHLFRFQYRMNDLAFVQMLMQKAGIYCYTVETEHGDQIVLGDDIDHYIYEPRLDVPYRENAGLEAAIESVFALETHARTVPQSFLVADYNPEQAWERFRDEANVAPQDPTTYGQPYVYASLLPQLRLLLLFQLWSKAETNAVKSGQGLARQCEVVSANPHGKGTGIEYDGRCHQGEQCEAGERRFQDGGKAVRAGTGQRNIQVLCVQDTPASLSRRGAGGFADWRHGQDHGRSGSRRVGRSTHL